MTQNKGPVLFYFWAHNIYEELATPTLVRLFDRVDTCFHELITKFETDSYRIEKNLNEVVKDGMITRRTAHMMLPFEHDMNAYLINLAHITGVSFALERTCTDLDMWNQMELARRSIIYDMPLSQAPRALTEHLKARVSMEKKREEHVANDICSFPGTVVVMFGRNHMPLEKLVAKHRETEVHSPYEPYPYSYSQKSFDLTREGKPIDRELILRLFAEKFTQNALFDGNSPTQRDRSGMNTRDVTMLSMYYADNMDIDTITQMRDFYRQNLAVCVANQYIQRRAFSIFLAQKGIEPVEETYMRLKS